MSILVEFFYWDLRFKNLRFKNFKVVLERVLGIIFIRVWKVNNRIGKMEVLVVVEREMKKKGESCVFGLKD